MPSSAKTLFSNKLLPGVEKIIETHNELNPPGRGKRQLTHLTHGGVLMLCAAWELYIEEVVVEAVNFLVRDATGPDFLPDRLKGKISQVAKNDKHAHGPLKLCGDGWKRVFCEAAKSDCDGLNTPKFGNIAQLFMDWLSVEQEPLKDAWRCEYSKINEFVTLRGEIAHRGADARYVRRDELKDFMILIENTVVDTDNFMAYHLKEISCNKRRPWNVVPVSH